MSKIRKLSPKGMKLLKTLHLIFVMMWVVGVVTMGLIYIIRPTTGDELYLSLRLIRLIDDLLVIPGAMLTALTAIIYGIWTNWGFFKHRWITVKWIASIVVILAGTFIFSPWLDNCLEVADRLRDGALSDPYIVKQTKLTIISVIVQSSILVFLVVISVYKPWRRGRS